MKEGLCKIQIKTVRVGTTYLKLTKTSHIQKTRTARVGTIYSKLIKISHIKKTNTQHILKIKCLVTIWALNSKNKLINLNWVFIIQF